MWNVTDPDDHLPKKYSLTAKKLKEIMTSNFDFNITVTCDQCGKETTPSGIPSFQRPGSIEGMRFECPDCLSREDLPGFDLIMLENCFSILAASGKFNPYKIREVIK